MVIHVFVYGSLKPGEENYRRYCQGRVQSEVEAIAQGELYDFPSLGYPAMTPGLGRVYGYVLSFDDAALLQALDRLEEYDPHRPMAENMYYRETIWVEAYTLRDGSSERQPLEAWCYLMHLDKIHTFGGVRVPSGQWTALRTYPPEAP